VPTSTSKPNEQTMKDEKVADVELQAEGPLPAIDVKRSADF
jgi:hypothetical protein